MALNPIVVTEYIRPERRALAHLACATAATIDVRTGRVTARLLDSFRSAAQSSKTARIDSDPLP